MGQARYDYGTHPPSWVLGLGPSWAGPGCSTFRDIQELWVGQARLQHPLAHTKAETEGGRLYPIGPSTHWHTWDLGLGVDLLGELGELPHGPQLLLVST